MIAQQFSTYYGADNCPLHYDPPKKWRDTIDPFSLNYRAFHLLEVLGYPHAGNDVFHVKGVYNETEMTAYIKVARQQGAAIANEVAILRQFDLPIIPRVLDADFGEPPYSVTTQMPGLRLSNILADNENMLSLAYMEIRSIAILSARGSKIIVDRSKKWTRSKDANGVT